MAWEQATLALLSMIGHGIGGAMVGAGTVLLFCGVWRVANGDPRGVPLAEWLRACSMIGFGFALASAC